MLHVLAEFPGEKLVASMINPVTWESIKERHYFEAREKLIGKKRDHIAMKEVLTAFSEKVRADTDDQSFVMDEILIKNGDPAAVIVQTAQEQHCDLIVIGTHGHGVITDLLIGSTAKRVVRKSKIPVLVARLPEKEG